MYIDVDNLEFFVLDYAKSFRLYTSSERKLVKKLNRIIVDHYNEDNEKEIDIFEKNEVIYELNNSLIITLFGKFENMLNTFCIVVKRALNINLDYENLRYSGFKRVLCYLESLTLINSKNINSFSKVDSWRIIRNHLTHDYGVPDIKNVKHVKSTRIFWNGETNILEATEENCSQLIEDVLLFFEEIVSEILNNIKNTES